MIPIQRPYLVCLIDQVEALLREIGNGIADNPAVIDNGSGHQQQPLLQGGPLNHLQQQQQQQQQAALPTQGSFGGKLDGGSSSLPGIGDNPFSNSGAFSFGGAPLGVPFIPHTHTLRSHRQPVCDRIIFGRLVVFAECKQLRCVS